MISPHSVFIGFFIYSFGLGTLFPRIGDIQLAMGLGETALGLALIWSADWPANIAVVSR